MKSMTAVEVAPISELQVNPYLNISNAAVLKLAQEGDVQAFGELFVRHADIVHNAAYRMLGPDRANEMLGEVFELALAGIGKFVNGAADPENSGKTTVGGWLYRITVNAILSNIRSDNRRYNAESPLVEGFEIAFGHTAVNALTSEKRSARSRHRAMSKALLKLTPDFREALIACHVNGMSYEQFADLNGIKYATVRTRVHRGVRELLAAAGVIDGKKNRRNAQLVAAYIGA